MPLSSSSSLVKYLHTGLLTEPAWVGALGRSRPEVLGMANGVEEVEDKESFVEEGVKDLIDRGAEEIEPVSPFGPVLE